MKNVEEIGKLGARFASFFMAAQADASYSRSECFIGRCEVMRNLRAIHVPGKVLADCVIVYGYRTDVDYI